jgi:hypothetical protein
MNLRRTIKRKSKHRKKTIRSSEKKYRGGEFGLTADEQADARAYKTIINDYITKQEINTKMDLEAVKYSLFKEKLKAISLITEKISDSEVNIKRDELKKLKSIVFFIIKDDVSAYDMFFDEKAAGFQIWIDNFIKYLINDAPFENAVTIKLLEGIKKRPYIKTSVDKNYNHFISDVNNMFAILKQESTDKEKTKEDAINKFIKTKTIKMKAEVEQVPEKK